MAATAFAAGGGSAALLLEGGACDRRSNTRADLAPRNRRIATSPASRSCWTKLSQGHTVRAGRSEGTGGGAAVATVPAPQKNETAAGIGIAGVHHVGLICEDTKRALDFYCGVLGLELNDDRKNVNLPYGGAWLWIGPQMIHLMELPNPDPTSGRPAHGGRDRHACLSVKSIATLREVLDSAGLEYTLSKSGRAALFTRDPDGNALEFQEAQISQ